MAEFDSLTLSRFWEKVDKLGPTECWIWSGARIKGYGVIKIHGRNFLAHRFSWTINHEEIPIGMLACHHCDNPPCVNPAHVFLGTVADNSADMVRKNRQADQCGENGPGVKLTLGEVKDIRASFLPQRELARRYGLNQSSISRIRNNKRWVWIQ